MSVRGNAMLAGLAFAATITSAARADEPTAHDRAVAAFTDARKSIEAGDCPTAIPKLKESLDDEPSIGADLSMADCLEVSDPLSAWTYVRDAGVFAASRHDDRAQVIELRATAVARNLPGLSFELARADAHLPGLEVRVDGRPIEPVLLTWPTYAVSEGVHVIEVSAPMRRTWSARVDATAHVVTQIRPLLATSEPPQPARVLSPTASISASAHEDPGATRRTVGIALAATGAGILAIGTTFAVLTLRKNSDIEGACGGDASHCTATATDVESQRESARTLGAIANTSLIVGGVLAAGGVVLAITAPHERSTTRASLGLGPRGVMLGGVW